MFDSSILINILFILLVVSSFLMTHFYVKTKELQDEIQELGRTFIENEVVKKWGEDYARILHLYESIDNYIEAHEQDFTIFRNNVGVFYKHVSALREFNTACTDSFKKTMLNSNIVTDKEIFTELLDQTTGTVDIEFKRLLIGVKDFIKNEEEAHKGSTEVIDVLNNIDNKYKDIKITPDIEECLKEMFNRIKEQHKINEDN